MTLIEILIVIVIIGLAATGLTFGLGALTRTKLRSSCMRVVAASRFSYNRAIAQGSTVRIAFDIEAGTMEVQEAHGKVALARADDDRIDRGGDGDEAGVDPWAAARERLHNALEPSLGSSPFGAIAGSDGQAIERYKAQPVGDGIRIVRLILPHEPEPRTSGKGSIYFFPSGMTEHAVVQLAKGDGETVYSVEIHPLTGRGKVHNFAFEPETIRDEHDEEEQSEVEDR